jgi:DNA-binding transcriptional MerR regulator
MNMSRIGQLAQQTGVGIETLRFYERRGLLRPAARLANGYRMYGPDELRRVILIRTAQSLGFTLREIKEVATADDGRLGCARLQSAVDAKLAELDRRIASLRQTRRRLKAFRRGCAGDDVGACPAVVRLTSNGTGAKRSRASNC